MVLGIVLCSMVNFPPPFSPPLDYIGTPSSNLERETYLAYMCNGNIDTGSLEAMVKYYFDIITLAHGMISFLLRIKSNVSTFIFLSEKKQGS